jgi:hypothetical protein
MSMNKILLLLTLTLVFVTVRADSGVVLPALANDLVCHYDFDHPVEGEDHLESNLGRSGTRLRLINGGADMRDDDPAYPGARRSLRTQQVNPAMQGNDDWKAGVYEPQGVASLHGFNAVSGITLMGWVKPLGPHPSPNSTTDMPDDTYNAVGLFGLLSGTSDGHEVRALLEVILVDGTPRLVALGRRDDTGNSLILAADENWQTLLQAHKWTHLAATFDFDEGNMKLYHNGTPLPATYTSHEDRWKIAGEPEPDVASASDPAGIKIGGSFPQNTNERNAFNGSFDELMFFNRSLTAAEVQAQFERFGATGRGEAR